MFKEQLAVLIGLSSHCFAWSWRPISPPSLSNSVHDDETGFQILRATVNGIGLSPDEIASVFTSTDTLDSYSRKSDCFQQAASQIRSRCGETHMNEDERVQGAISMTLCELATARHHSPPLECSTFSDNHVPPGSRRHSQGACVEALSRSAQFWSSYSGYLREIPQLCHAYRRWHDIDTAKDIYKNATLEKLSLIRIIIDREKATKDAIRSWEYSSQDLQTILNALTVSSAHISSATDTIVARVEDSLHSISPYLHKAMIDLQSCHNDIMLQSSVKIRDMLQEISLHHADSLSTILPKFEEAFAHRLESIFLPILEQNSYVLESARYAHQQWDVLRSDFSIMQHIIGELLTSVSHVAMFMNVSTQQALNAQKLQQEVTDSAATLVDVLVQLTTTTRTELIAINDTATAMKERMRHTDTNEWLRISATSLLRAILPGVSQLPYLLNPRWIHFMLFSGKLLWYLLQMGFSILTSAFLLLYSKQALFHLLPFSAPTTKGDTSQDPILLSSSTPFKLPAKLHEVNRSQFCYLPPRLARFQYRSTALQPNKFSSPLEKDV